MLFNERYAAMKLKLLTLCLVLASSQVEAFGIQSTSDVRAINSVRTQFSFSFGSSTQLFSTPPKRVARRDLKKRSRRRRDGKSRTLVEEAAQESQTSNSIQNIETRPLVRSRSVEAGEDYWIDEKDLQRSLEREQAIKNRKAMEGEISKDKLRTEVVAPYKQNWIGYFSVFIIVIATIIKEFPELLNAPVIPIPDL